jgi:hypothetical protein
VEKWRNKKIKERERNEVTHTHAIDQQRCFIGRD